jgi:hypothetical protein
VGRIEGESGVDAPPDYAEDDVDESEQTSAHYHAPVEVDLMDGETEDSEIVKLDKRVGEGREDRHDDKAEVYRWCKRSRTCACSNRKRCGAHIALREYVPNDHPM